MFSFLLSRAAFLLPVKSEISSVFIAHLHWYETTFIFLLMGFIPPRILNINLRYTDDFVTHFRVQAFIGLNSAQLVLIVNKLITSNLVSVWALRNAEQTISQDGAKHILSPFIHPVIFLFFFLPELNNSQNTLARFYVVSNAEEVLPPAMSE